MKYYHNLFICVFVWIGRVIVYAHQKKSLEFGRLYLMPQNLLAFSLANRAYNKKINSNF